MGRFLGAEKAQTSLAHKALSSNPSHRSSRSGTRARIFIFLKSLTPGHLSVPKKSRMQKIAAFSNRKVQNRKFCRRNRRKLARKSLCPKSKENRKSKKSKEIQKSKERGIRENRSKNHRKNLLGCGHRSVSRFSTSQHFRDAEPGTRPGNFTNTGGGHRPKIFMFLEAFFFHEIWGLSEVRKKRVVSKRVVLADQRVSNATLANAAVVLSSKNWKSYSRRKINPVDPSGFSLDPKTGTRVQKRNDGTQNWNEGTKNGTTVHKEERGRIRQNHP